MDEQVTSTSSDPVYYCTTCLSLSIMHDEYTDSDYCKDCGSTNIGGPIDFEIWETLYEKKYGKKYVEKTGDIRKSPIFKLPLNKLMNKVADSPKCDFIIHQIYSHFPKGFSRADSVVMFFDRLVKDNLLDKLRTLLYNMKIQ